MLKRGHIDWPTIPLKLTHPDFFLWGYLKSKVYASNPQTIEELKTNSCAEITGIQLGMLKKVVENAAKKSYILLWPIKETETKVLWSGE